MFMQLYSSPIGQLLLTADDTALVALHFCDKGRSRLLSDNAACNDHAIFQAAKQWLDVYFSGQEPSFMPPLRPVGTAFQQEVWQLLRAIPYGKTTTYGETAAALAARHGIPRMSAQAVGGAVGRNPIPIFIPCHRVVGSGGKLTGYSGGLEKKQFLLSNEHIDNSTLQRNSSLTAVL